MGRLGKDINPFEWLLLASVVVLANCSAETLDGRYAGAVDTDEGVCGARPTGGRSNGSLLIRGGDVVFAPDEGVLSLAGHIDAHGHIIATSTAPGADHKPFTMAFEGDLRDGRVSGRYATPRCRASVRLDRAAS